MSRKSDAYSLLGFDLPWKLPVRLYLRRDRVTTVYTFRYSDNADCRRLFDETQWITVRSVSSVRDNPRPLASSRTVANIENTKSEVF